MYLHEKKDNISRSDHVKTVLWYIVLWYIEVIKYGTRGSPNVLVPVILPRFSQQLWSTHKMPKHICETQIDEYKFRENSGKKGCKRATGRYGKEPRSDTCIDFIAADRLSSFHQIHLIASQHSFPTCTSTNYPTVPSSLL